MRLSLRILVMKIIAASLAYGAGCTRVAKTVRNVAIPIEMMRVNTSMVVTIVVEREKSQ